MSNSKPSVGGSERPQRSTSRNEYDQRMGNASRRLLAGELCKRAREIAIRIVGDELAGKLEGIHISDWMREHEAGYPEQSWTMVYSAVRTWRDANAVNGTTPEPSTAEDDDAVDGEEIKIQADGSNLDDEGRLKIYQECVEQYSKIKREKNGRLGKGFGAKALCAKAKAKYGWAPSHAQIQKAAKAGAAPATLKKPRCDKHMPVKITEYILHLGALFRKHSIPFYRWDIIQNAKVLLKACHMETQKKWVVQFENAATGTDRVWNEDKFIRWFAKDFLGQDNVRMGKQRSLDAQRALWCTSGNFKQHYKIYCDKHVACGMATYNPEWNWDNPKRDVPVLRWIDSEMWRSASGDETHANADTSPGGRSNTSEKTCIIGTDDDGEAISSGGCAHITMFGGYFNDRQPIIPTTIIAATQVTAEILAQRPVVHIAGTAYTGHIMLSTSGGVLNDNVIELIKKSIHWRWSDTPGVWKILTLDGVGEHINAKFLQWCLDNHIWLILRTPFGSSKQQPEDIYLFWLWKNSKEWGFYMRKQVTLQRLYVTYKTTSLNVEKTMFCAKVPWEKTMTEANIARAIGEDGGGYVTTDGTANIKPFFDLLEKEQSASSAAGRRGLKRTHVSDEELQLLGEQVLPLFANVKQRLSPAEYESSMPTAAMRSKSLHAGDLALLGDGANGPQAMELVRFKTSVAQICGSKAGLLERTCKRYMLDPKGRNDQKAARLLLLEAIHSSTVTGFDTLPQGWFEGVTNKKYRVSLGEESAKLWAAKDQWFMSLDERQIRAVKKILPWWIEEGKRSADGGDAASSVSAAAAEPNVLDIEGWATSAELGLGGAENLAPPPAPPTFGADQDDIVSMSVRLPVAPGKASNNSTTGRGKREKKPVGSREVGGE